MLSEGNGVTEGNSTNSSFFVSRVHDTNNTKKIKKIFQHFFMLQNCIFLKLHRIFIKSMKKKLFVLLLKKFYSHYVQKD